MQTHLSNERREVLVAIMNDPTDFVLAQEQHWYRILVDSTPKHWPPQWLAFYQTPKSAVSKVSAQRQGATDSNGVV